MAASEPATTLATTLAKHLIGLPQDETWDFLLTHLDPGLHPDSPTVEALLSIKAAEWKEEIRLEDAVLLFDREEPKVLLFDQGGSAEATIFKDGVPIGQDPDHLEVPMGH